MSIAFLCLTYNGMNPSLKSAKLPNVFMNTKETSNSKKKYILFLPSGETQTWLTQHYLC